ncbi:MSHA biogenesis protein MshP [Massilia sp. G4R7]|uniref:MSHA biogenesis protein MshP n=1 Tax=Massilia phyllostachyos TaxID=2898585 RepID=A0ABS8Q8C4_9BURK|nr:MSHA biogenesis protein MshP [Massilia phyllostachyos]MCD2518008.1 MSHA biogenesis protein MshP [Massilia phyllostachyos]
MMRRPQRGFAYIAAVVILLLVAGVSVALVRMSGTQHSTVNQTLLGVRAGQAARAGIEWMFYRLTHDGKPAGCPDNSALVQLNDFKADTGFLVSVSCSITAQQPFNEGEKPDGTVSKKYVYRIEAVACNGGAASCIGNAGVTQPDYVERRRVATVCMTSEGSDCY